MKTVATQPKKATKKVTPKGKSNSQLKIEARIQVLEQKRADEGLTAHEARILQNNKYKLESRSASKLYKDAKALPKKDLNEMLGKAKFPTFEAFVKELPTKHLYSMWDALGVLTRLNKSEIQRAKASAQQKKENAK